jgi:phosphatidylglycerophosphate synthase
VATIELRPTVTGKPRELQGFLNRTLYHPAARRFAALLVPTPVTPNMVSILGAAMVVTAGVLYARIGTPAAIAIGFVVHLLWHVVDGADGDLARMTGRASPIGEVVDGMCDYLGHTALYLLLASSLDDSIGATAWVLAFAAGGSRAIQSVFAESSRRTYQWWAYGVPWIQHNKTAATGVGGILTGAYLGAANLLNGATGTVNALVASAEADPAERQRIARLVRESGPGFLALPAVLGANPRTIMLGVSMLAGSPIWFFLVEALLLNVVLIAGVLRQHAQCRRLVAMIGRGRN